MNRRSLLDYLSNDHDQADEPAHPARDAASELEQRLADLERRLNAAVHPEPATNGADDFSSQIETILRRSQTNSASAPAPQAPAAPVRPTQQRMRVEMPAPPLVPDMPQARDDRSAEFTRFVEAVHLIGQAANRFLNTAEPKRATMREGAEPVDREAIKLTLALKEAVSAFQSVTHDLSSAAAEIRQAATARPIAPPSPPVAQPAPVSRDDREFHRLQDDLDDLRERLQAMVHRRRRESY